MNPEVKKALTELQQKNQKVQIKDLQITQMKRAKQENENVAEQFSKIPSDSIVYESVGRSFILAEFKQMKENIVTENKIIDEKVNVLEYDKDVLNRSIEQSKENIRELLQQKQNQL